MGPRVSFFFATMVSMKMTPFVERGGGGAGGVISNLWKVACVLVRRARPYLIRALRVLLPSQLRLLNSRFSCYSFCSSSALFLLTVRLSSLTTRSSVEM